MWLQKIVLGQFLGRTIIAVTRQWFADINFNNYSFNFFVCPKGEEAVLGWVRAAAVARIVHGDGHWKSAQCHVRAARCYLDIQGCLEAVVAGKVVSEVDKLLPNITQVCMSKLTCMPPRGGMCCWCTAGLQSTAWWRSSTHWLRPTASSVLPSQEKDRIHFQILEMGHSETVLYCLVMVFLM